MLCFASILQDFTASLFCIGCALAPRIPRPILFGAGCGELRCFSFLHRVHIGFPNSLPDSSCRAHHDHGADELYDFSQYLVNVVTGASKIAVPLYFQCAGNENACVAGR